MAANRKTEGGVDVTLLRKVEAVLSGDHSTLTPQERELVLRLLSRRLGRKPDPKLPVRDIAIAILSALYEANGTPTESAVIDVARRCGVSRSQVFTARRQLRPIPFKKNIPPPDVLPGLIIMFERLLGIASPADWGSLPSPVARSLDALIARLRKSGVDALIDLKESN